MILRETKLKIDNLVGQDEDLVIDGKSFSSRLMLGTGKYKNTDLALSSIMISQASIVTVAVRRLQSSNILDDSNILHGLPLDTVWLLPNTAGCTTVQEAIRVASLGHEICKRLGQVNNKFVKLEVISDPQYLLPDPIGTLKAAEYLVNKGYSVLPYMYPDPILARQLEEIGCSTVMPLASPIGSGQGLQNIENLQIIIENSSVPVIIDAGLGTSSDAVKSIEIGASAVLVNSAIANSQSPELMAKAMQLGVKSGRYSYLSKRMVKSDRAVPSSPSTGLLF
uniref:Thiazole synthase n=1 Tax=Helminthora furcellata TaxID=1884666 RepID=A0A1G4NZ27_9FLOR|nr:thiG protein [Helminthora furcellata]SCW21045.1 thiG protein [Helminthora furcellata]SCW23905.1 thiG protein [Helminthora furcellata]